jgi:integral membrane protein (TIGR01906 family)
MEHTTPLAKPPFLVWLWTTIVQFVLVGVFPFLLVTVNVRLVMSPAFLYFEYTRPGFPADPFGLSQAERLEYGPFAVQYLLTWADVTYLGDLRFPDGTPLFNARELRHMYDVKILTQITFITAVIAGALWLVGTYTCRHKLDVILMQGSLITLGIIASIVVGAIVNWDGFFTGFHTLFFENDTWYFAYSDTLIRLFPEQFWFDAALFIGGLTTIQAGAVVLVIRFWQPLRDVFSRSQSPE